MFNFKWNVKESFRRVKEDILNFKASVNDWVLFLDRKRNKIEKRLDNIEDRIDKMEEAMFKVLSLR